MTPRFLEQGSCQRQGKVQIFGGVGQGEGNRAPQLPMSLSPPGRILANMHVRASEVACG